ncbi:MAG TPA: phosphate acyltransferase, partial [Clostridia bacterium]|nr:phosphate acyltransferase [Clostridia bacterium]
MSLIVKLKDRAKECKRTIVLPEGNEIRNIVAAAAVHKEGIADIILLGDEKKAHDIAREANVDISGVRIINPATSELLEVYAKEFYELRKSKGITYEDARKIVKDEVYFGTMMVKMGD